MLLQECVLAQVIQLQFTRLFFLMRVWGLGMRLLYLVVSHDMYQQFHPWCSFSLIILDENFYQTFPFDVYIHSSVCVSFSSSFLTIGGCICGVPILHSQGWWWRFRGSEFLPPAFGYGSLVPRPAKLCQCISSVPALSKWESVGILLRPLCNAVM